MNVCRERLKKITNDKPLTSILSIRQFHTYNHVYNEKFVNNPK